MKGPFFYRHNGQQIGPLTTQEFKQHAADGRLLPDDLVTAAGLAGWQPANRLNNVFPKPAPPPLPLPGEATKEPAVTGGPAVGATKPANNVGGAEAVKQQSAKKLAEGTKFAWQEAGATGKACAAQAKRSLTYGRSLVDARSAEQRALTAQQSLGEQLHAAGLGDAALRGQLVQLAERRKSVEVAKGAVKLLEAERRGLCIRLAEPFLGQEPPSESLAEAHRQAVTLKQELQMVQQRNAQQRSELLPSEAKDRLRIVAGCAAVAMLLVAVWWFFGGASKSNEVAPAQSAAPKSPKGDAEQAPISPAP